MCTLHKLQYDKVLNIQRFILKKKVFRRNSTGALRRLRFLGTFRRRHFRHHIRRFTRCRVGGGGVLLLHREYPQIATEFQLQFQWRRYYCYKYGNSQDGNSGHLGIQQPEHRCQFYSILFVLDKLFLIFLFNVTCAFTYDITNFCIKYLYSFKLQRKTTNTI